MSDSIKMVNAVIKGRDGAQPRILVVTFSTNNPTVSVSFNTALNDLQAALNTWGTKYGIQIDFNGGPKND